MYSNAESDNGMIAYASSFPGSIRAFEIAPGQEIVAQKSAFLAATEGIDLSIFFLKKLSSGFFGGLAGTINLVCKYLRICICINLWYNNFR